MRFERDQVGVRRRSGSDRVLGGHAEEEGRLLPQVRDAVERDGAVQRDHLLPGRVASRLALNDVSCVRGKWGSKYRAGIRVPEVSGSCFYFNNMTIILDKYIF